MEWRLLYKQDIQYKENYGNWLYKIVNDKYAVRMQT